MRALRAAQSAVLDAEPHPYYVSAYHQQETRYWLHIPRWIYMNREEMQGARVLDVGSGYGTLAVFCDEVLGAQVYCIDMASGLLSPSLARTRGFTFAVCNVERDPFPWDIRFDVILATEVLEHFNLHPLPTLRRLLSLLADEGRVYLSTPDAAEWGKGDNLYASLDRIPMSSAHTPVFDGHVYLYQAEELVGLVERAGFKLRQFDHAPGVGARHLNLELVRVKASPLHSPGSR